MNEREKTHDLAQLVQQATAELAAEYRRVQSRISEDPGTGGDQGEENWAALLKQWLPAGFHVRTKGRIIGVNGSASPQVDVLILSPAYPVGLLDKKLYLSAGVVAAFECKTTLRRDHIRKVMKNSAALGAISRESESSARHIIYGILAHSHAIPSKRDRPGAVLSRAIDKATREGIRDPRDCIDFVCVANLGTWTLTRILWESDVPGFEAALSTMYMGPLLQARFVDVELAWDQSTPDPIGILLTSLFRRMADTDSAISPLVDYFSGIGLRETGAGMAIQWLLEKVPPQLQVINDANLVVNSKMVPSGRATVVMPENAGIETRSRRT